VRGVVRRVRRARRLLRRWVGGAGAADATAAAETGAFVPRGDAASVARLDEVSTRAVGPTRPPEMDDAVGAGSRD
jgi:hypothetical protein